MPPFDINKTSHVMPKLQTTVICLAFSLNMLSRWLKIAHEIRYNVMYSYNLVYYKYYFNWDVTPTVIANMQMSEFLKLMSEYKVVYDNYICCWLTIRVTPYINSINFYLNDSIYYHQWYYCCLLSVLIINTFQQCWKHTHIHIVCECMCARAGVIVWSQNTKVRSKFIKSAIY